MKKLFCIFYFLTFFFQFCLAQCSNIDTVADTFSSQITYYSPTYEGISLTKVVEKKIVDYYLSIITTGNTVVVDGIGFAILFDNNFKFINNTEKVEIETNKNGDGYEYRIFYKIKKKEFNLFTKHKIVVVKNYIFQNTITEGENIRTAMNCLISN